MFLVKYFIKTLSANHAVGKLLLRDQSLWQHRHLHKLAQTLYTLTKISTGYLGQPL